MTRLIDLIEDITADDLPTNEFTIEDTDPMVILGKLNEVVATLENIRDEKQDSLTAEQLEAVNSGIDAIKVALISTNANDIANLKAIKYCANISVNLNSSTFVLTIQLKDQDGNNIGTTQTIDLPLESVVVNGTYDNVNKKIILTLVSGSTIDIPVGDLVSGLQSEITVDNKLSADLVDDTSTINKFVTASDKTNWNNKSNFSGDYNDLTNKPTIPTALSQLSDDSTHRVVTDTEKSTWNGKQNANECVKYSEAQALTDEQKAQARSNIGAGSSGFSGDYNELTNKPTIPTALSQLSEDSTHRVVTDSEKSTWNGKQNANECVKYNEAQTLSSTQKSTARSNIGAGTSSFSGSYTDLSNKPTIPTALSDLTSDTTHRVVTDTDITNWNNAKINSSGTNYIRYENGIQMCWGFYDHGSNINDKSGIVVNFPVSFKSGTTPTFLETSGKLDGNAANRTTQANYYALSNTSVSFGWYGGTARSAGWLAIGYWK